MSNSDKESAGTGCLRNVLRQEADKGLSVRLRAVNMTLQIEAHIKVFKSEQQVVKYDPQLEFSVALFFLEIDILQIRIEMT